MNKLNYSKTKYFKLFGKTIFTTTENYTEYFQENVEIDDLPPIQVTQNYHNQEFNIDNNNNKQH